MSLRDLLPLSLREVADHAGAHIACAVALEFGGTVWRVPSHKTHPDAVRLRDLVGEAPVITLTLTLGGHSLDVPLARRAVVRWLAERGMGTTAIAARLHMTRSTVRRYMREGRG
ncbi:helix-turn-helix domain-containing protein [Ruegeria sp.]|uniref:helix-turn-helix domain-containing protein n=1 Tax=Ruegeria sp. TaxID=1879320 RepID=UPI003B5C8B9C